MELSIPMNKKTIKVINLKAIEHKMLQSTSVGSSFQSKYQCLSSVLTSETYNCSNNCTPLLFKTIMELNSNESLSLCETAEDNVCMASSMYRYTHIIYLQIIIKVFSLIKYLTSPILTLDAN